MTCTHTLSSGSRYCEFESRENSERPHNPGYRHQNLKKTHVNKYALVYHWQGSDDSLKPALLTAHQGLSVSAQALLAR